MNIWLCPLGCPTPPRFFQALVNDVLRRHGRSVHICLPGDILIFSSSLQDMFSTSGECSRGCLRMGFCQGGEMRVSCTVSNIFGLRLSSEGMRMDPDKVKAVVDWPTPDSRKACRGFWVRQFLQAFYSQFSQLAAPLTALTSTKTAFRWSEAAEAAFTNLKSRFVRLHSHAPDPHVSLWWRLMRQRWG